MTSEGEDGEEFKVYRTKICDGELLTDVKLIVRGSSHPTLASASSRFAWLPWRISFMFTVPGRDLSDSTMTVVIEGNLGEFSFPGADAASSGIHLHRLS